MRDRRFLADAMLGGLARWLRVLGYDTHYDPLLDDPALVAMADREGRTLLTRDRHLVTFLRPSDALLIRQDAPLAQLREVLSHAALEPVHPLFSRCLVCNTLLREASAQECAELAPASSRLPGEPLLFCPGCQRLYWHGSHTRRMRHQLAMNLPEWFTLD